MKICTLFILTLLSLQLQAQDKLNVLLVLAHYDDETMVSSMLTRLSDQGANINAIYLTKGEGGTDIRGEIQDKEKLIFQREQEMKKSAQELNIKNYFQLDAGDVPLRIPEEGYPNPAGRPTTSGQKFMESGIWNMEDLKSKMKVIIEDNNLKPDLIITLGNDTGVIHAHHQATNHLTLELLSEGSFGKQVKGAYGIVESQWYDVHKMPYKKSVLYFDVNSFRGKVQSQKHIEQAYAAYQAHVSQGPSLKKIEELSEVPEMLTPLRKTDDLKYLEKKLGHSTVKAFENQKNWTTFHQNEAQWKLTCGKHLLKN